MCKAGGQGVDCFDVMIQGRRMQGKELRSFFEGCEFCLDLQSLGIKISNAAASVVLSDDPLHNQINVSRAFTFDPRPLASSLAPVAVVARRYRSSSYWRA